MQTILLIPCVLTGIKLISKWELYDIENDRSEMTDLALKMTEKVSEMETMYNLWASENNILPWAEIKKLQNKKKQK